MEIQVEGNRKYGDSVNPDHVTSFMILLDVIELSKSFSLLLLRKTYKGRPKRPSPRVKIQGFHAKIEIKASTWTNYTCLFEFVVLNFLCWTSWIPFLMLKCLSRKKHYKNTFKVLLHPLCKTFFRYGVHFKLRTSQVVPLSVNNHPSCIAGKASFCITSYYLLRYYLFLLFWGLKI